MKIHGQRSQAGGRSWRLAEGGHQGKGQFLSVCPSRHETRCCGCVDSACPIGHLLAHRARWLLRGRWGAGRRAGGCPKVPAPQTGCGVPSQHGDFPPAAWLQAGEKPWTHLMLHKYSSSQKKPFCIVLSFSIFCLNTISLKTLKQH